MYVLACEDDCFYVGKTEDLSRRMEAHMEGEGARWTEKHPPINYFEVLPNIEAEQLDVVEKETTIDYAKKFGGEKVRGWCWTRVDRGVPDEWV